MFTRGSGDWTEYRQLAGLVEVDFHYESYSDSTYWERMATVAAKVFHAIEAACRTGDRYVMFRYGWHTSRRGKTTARSVVRKIMRGKLSTRFIDRRCSIRHQRLFVAAIRPLPERLAR